MIYGITHKVDRSPIMRPAKATKVQIGVPKGNAIYVFIHNGKWYCKMGRWVEVPGRPNKLEMAIACQGTRAEVEKFYRENWMKAPISNRPQELKFFTFTRKATAEVGGKTIEMLEPDFDQIEAHGNVPTRIPIILMHKDPFNSNMSHWSATKLKCSGDGLYAMRSVDMPGDAVAAKEAVDAGEKYYPFEPCASVLRNGTLSQVGGCPFADKECKSHGVLTFQLANRPAIGSTCYLSTTGKVSIGALSSNITEFQAITDMHGVSLVGLRCDLILEQFLANPTGKGASQKPKMRLEINASSMDAMKRMLSEGAWTPSKQISAASVEDAEESAPIHTAEVSGVEFTSEFVDDDSDEAELVQVAPAATVEAKTAKKAATLADRVTAMAVKAVPEDTPVAEAPPAAKAMPEIQEGDAF